MSDESVTDLLGPLPQPAAPAMVVDQVTAVFARVGVLADENTLVPGLDQTYGLRVADMRALALAVAETYGDDHDLCRSIALASWPRGTIEHRFFALELIAATLFSPDEFWELGLRFLPDVQTWADCDELCSTTLSSALNGSPAYLDDLETWVTHDNFWVRRAAIVTTVYLRRSDYDEETLRKLDRRVLGMCEKLLEDTESYVRKAVDWTVREVVKRNYELACGWLIRQARRTPSRRAQTLLKLSAKKLRDEDQRIFLALLAEE